MMKPREQSADRYSDISLPLPDSLCSAMNSSSRRERKAERGRQEVGRERTGLSSQNSKESAADQGVKLIYIPSSNSVAFDLFFFFPPRVHLPSYWNVGGRNENGTPSGRSKSLLKCAIIKHSVWQKPLNPDFPSANGAGPVQLGF